MILLFLAIATTTQVASFQSPIAGNSFVVSRRLQTESSCCSSTRLLCGMIDPSSVQEGLDTVSTLTNPLLVQQHQHQQSIITTVMLAAANNNNNNNNNGDGATSFVQNSDVWVFVVGIIPFGWATIEFWRRIAVGESFGTGSDSVVIGEDLNPESSRGRRILGKDALVVAYILFAVAGAVLGLVLYTVATSEAPPADFSSLSSQALNEDQFILMT